MIFFPAANIIILHPLTTSMKIFYYFLSILFIVISNNIHAQQAVSILIKNSRTGDPLAGASVTILRFKTIPADSNGLVTITLPANTTDTVQVSCVGYKKTTVIISMPTPAPVTIPLEEDETQLNAIVVQTTRTNRNLADIPTRIEVIAPEELDEKSTMSPGDIRMLLNESTGITTQQTSAASGNAGFKMQGLDSRYTQLLKDGMPLYSGYSGGLGILQIPPLDLQQVEFVKGSASTLYGGGAITGLVNLISKTPSYKRDMQLLLNANSAKGFDGSGFYSKKWQHAGLSFLGSYNYNGAYDPAHTGFTAIPETKRVVLNPKLFLYFSKKTTAWFGLNTAFEQRSGGDMQVINGKADSTHQYFEKNNTSRVSTQFMLNHTINGSSNITFKNAVGFFNRQILLPEGSFNGLNVSSFSEASYVFKRKKMEWVAGISLNTEHFKPKDTTTLKYQLTTAGAFVQNTWKAASWLSVESGLRAEHQFVLPNINALLKFNSHFTSRIGWGLGYAMPTPFIDDAEKVNYQNVHSPDLSVVKAETSYGIHADLNYQQQFDEWGITVNQLFFYTKLDNYTTLQNGYIVNPPGSIDTRGAETNARISLDDLGIYLGYAYTDANQHVYNTTTQLPLVARHRANMDVTYEIENSFRFGVEGFYTGSQQLSDGSTGRSFYVFGVLVQKMWKRLDLFINAENLTDQRQTKWGSIYTGNMAHPVFADIYAPLDGRVINGGIRLKL
jgi:iron complex outermembrane receptor protein